MDTTNISADRPGVGTSPYVLNGIGFQIETGLALEHTEINYKPVTIWYPNTSLFRYEVSRNFELRLQNEFVALEPQYPNLNGLHFAQLGAKIALTENKGLLPKTSLMTNINKYNIILDETNESSIMPSLKLLMQNDINDELNISYNFGLKYVNEKQSPTFFSSICIEKELTENISTFIESYNFESSAYPTEYYVDFGITSLVKRNLQIDLSGNLFLNDIDHYYMINVGASWHYLN